MEFSSCFKHTQTHEYECGDTAVVECDMTTSSGLLVFIYFFVISN